MAAVTNVLLIVYKSLLRYRTDIWCLRSEPHMLGTFALVIQSNLAVMWIVNLDNRYIPLSCPLRYLLPLCHVDYYDVWLRSGLRTKDCLCWNQSVYSVIYYYIVFFYFDLISWIAFLFFNGKHREWLTIRHETQIIILSIYHITWKKCIPTLETNTTLYIFFLYRHPYDWKQPESQYWSKYQ